MEIIKARELNVFDNIQVDVSFSITMGEIASICGESYEKDLLFDFLTFKRKVKPDTLFYNNFDYSLFQKTDITELMVSDVKVVSDINTLFSFLSIRDNILAPEYVNRKVIDYSYFDEILTSLNYDLPQTNVSNLNKLDRIKVEIIRALMSKPFVIFLNNVDKSLSKEDLAILSSFITSINNIYHITFIIFTNNFDFSRIASRRIYFESNSFVEFSE